MYRGKTCKLLESCLQQSLELVLEWDLEAGHVDEFKQILMSNAMEHLLKLN